MLSASSGELVLSTCKTASCDTEDALAAERQVIHLWGHAYNFLALHPCATLQMGLQPKVTCHGCGRIELVSLRALLRTRHGHAPWAEIMPRLRCSVCGSPPSDLIFDARNAAGLHQSEVGRLSIRAPQNEESPAPGR